MMVTESAAALLPDSTVPHHKDRIVQKTEIHYYYISQHQIHVRRFDMTGVSLGERTKLLPQVELSYIYIYIYIYIYRVSQEERT